MIQQLQSSEYKSLIKKIRTKRVIVTVLAVILLFATIFVCSPTKITVMGETVVSREGANPVIIVLLVLLILFLECIAYAAVSSPMTKSMDVECDPHKHLILNWALSNGRNIDHIYANDYIYMGDFGIALEYSRKMINSSKPALKIVGLFNKARCEYFMGDFNSLKLTVEEYRAVLSGLQIKNQKSKELYEKMQKVMELMVALSDKDKEKISTLCDINPWNNSIATQGYINYLKGEAAYFSEDRINAVSCFESVKENCEKTIFSKMAEQYLAELNNN